VPVFLGGPVGKNQLMFAAFEWKKGDGVKLSHNIALEKTLWCRCQPLGSEAKLRTNSLENLHHCAPLVRSRGAVSVRRVRPQLRGNGVAQVSPSQNACAGRDFQAQFGSFS
jgi:hypothetical protein